MATNTLPYRIGMIGCPSQPHVPWTAETLTQVQALGFNALQLNIAWGIRPADEPLNLEDVVTSSAAWEQAYPQSVPLRADQSPAAIERRRADLRHRIALCQAAGLRTLFHFGAPYNGAEGYLDHQLPNCLLDGNTPQRYVTLIEQFAAQFPGVDDLLLYSIISSSV